MQLGYFIDTALEKKGLKRRDLYEFILSSCYGGDLSKYTTYPSMSARITDNKLSAEEFLYAAVFLDLNVARMCSHIEDLIKNKSPKLPSYIKEILLRNSRYFREGLDASVLSNNMDLDHDSRYYLLLMDEENKVVTLEYCNLDIRFGQVLVKIDFKKESESAFYEFKSLNKEKQLDYMLSELECSRKIANDEMYVVDSYMIKIPEINWKIEMAYVDDSILRYLDKLDISSEEIQSGLYDQIIKQIGLGRINKLSTAVIQGCMVHFEIIEEEFNSLNNSCLDVRLNVLIQNIE